MNAAIESVKIKFVIAATHNVEVMSLDRVTGFLEVDPLGGMPKDHLSHTVAQSTTVWDLFDFDMVTGIQCLPIEVG